MRRNGTAETLSPDLRKYVLPNPEGPAPKIRGDAVGYDPALIAQQLRGEQGDNRQHFQPAQHHSRRQNEFDLRGHA